MVITAPPHRLADAEIRGPPTGRRSWLFWAQTPVWVNSSGTLCARLNGGYGPAAGTLPCHSWSPVSPPLMAAAAQWAAPSTASPRRWPRHHQPLLRHSCRRPPLPFPVAGRAAINGGCCKAAGARPCQSQSPATNNRDCSTAVGTLWCQSPSPAVPPPAMTPSRRPSPSPVSPWHQNLRYPIQRHRHPLQWRYRKHLRASGA